MSDSITVFEMKTIDINIDLIVSIVLFLIVIFITLKILFWLINLIKRAIKDTYILIKGLLFDPFDVSIDNKTLYSGFIISLVIVPSFAKNMINVIGLFFARSFRNGARFVDQLNFESTRCMQYTNQIEEQVGCIYKFSMVSIKSAYELVSSVVTSVLFNINITSILNFILIWLIVSILIENLYANKENNDESNKLKEWVKVNILTPVFLSRLLLGISLYLTLSAIIAVPLMSNSSNLHSVDISTQKDSLKASLQQYRDLSSSNNRIINPSNLSILNESFEESASKLLKKYIEQKKGNEKIKSRKSEVDELISLTNDRRTNELESYIKNRTVLVSKINTLINNEFEYIEKNKEIRDSFIRNADLYLQKAISHYIRQNTGRIGIRETSQHFSSVEEWYRNTIRDSLKNVVNCNDALLTYQQSLKNIIKNLARTDKRIIQRDIYINNDVPDIDQVFRRSNKVSSVCSNNNTISEFVMPNRAEYGSYLGVIGGATRWILKTESLTLALIVGLVGCGVLGALISRIIRRETELDENFSVDLVSYSDLVGVFYRGFAAAIVVFLSSYGAIGIISNSTGDPNAYVVFAFCLVGAVYSDVVWDWARRKLVNSTSEGTPQTTDKNNAS